MIDTSGLRTNDTKAQDMLLAVQKIESDVIGVPIPERIYCPDNCQYGAPFVAAEYCCGFGGQSNVRIRGEWSHGWHPPEHNVHPELVVGSDGLSCRNRYKKNFWMARKDQVDYLKSSGYRRVEAIGLPIIYLPKVDVIREKGTLLVMPVHSLASTIHNWDFEKYADQINLIKNRFSRVVVCVHPDCIAKDYWAPSFIARGIPVISGANIKDRNSLLRMAVLFSRFEFVTTNGFGSHLVYSAFFGAKPSIYGSLAKYSENDFKKDTIYSNCPELLPIVLKMCTEEYLRKKFEKLFFKPWEAEERKKWAEFQLGFQHKISPRLLMKFFFNLKTRLRFHFFALFQR